MATQLPTAAEVISGTQTNAEQKTDFAAMLNFLADHLAEGTTAGTSTAYTLAPVPAIAAYAAGQHFSITVHTAAGANPTININGLGATVNLVYKKADGTVVNVNNNLPAGVYQTVMLSATQMLVLEISSYKLLQTLEVASSALGSGTTVIPLDDTPPLVGEGIGTGLTQAIVPKSTVSLLEISVQVICSSTVANNMIAALFQDSTAVAATVQYLGAGGATLQLNITFSMLAGTTSSTTFSVRFGGSLAGTSYFNGAGGARHFGGISNSFIRVKEYI